jgi:hypothetical protein
MQCVKEFSEIYFLIGKYYNDKNAQRAISFANGPDLDGLAQ